SREEFLTLTLKDIRPDESVDELEESWAKRRESPKLFYIGNNVHRKKDGTLIDVEMITHDITFEGRKARIALINDVTDTRKAQETLHLLIDVTAAASESEDLHTTTSRCLELICTLKNWQVGQAWFVDEKQKQLFCSHSFYSELDITEFRGETLKIHYSKGKGLPGQVWDRNAPFWISDLKEQALYHRAHSAVKAGLRGCFAFPIRFESKIVAVFEFFSTQTRTPDPYFLEAVEKLSSHLGVVFARRR